MRWAIGLVIAIGVPGCGLAQFFGMATPGDGSRVYFATPSRVKASGQNPYGKIFQYDTNGLRLVAARDPVPLAKRDATVQWRGDERRLIWAWPISPPMAS